MSTAAGARIVARRTALGAVPGRATRARPPAVSGTLRPHRPRPPAGRDHRLAAQQHDLLPVAGAQSTSSPPPRRCRSPSSRLAPRRRSRTTLAGGDPPDFQWANDLQLYVWPGSAPSTPPSPTSTGGARPTSTTSPAALPQRGQALRLALDAEPHRMLVNRDLYEQKARRPSCPGPARRPTGRSSSGRRSPAGSTRAGPKTSTAPPTPRTTPSTGHDDPLATRRVLRSRRATCWSALRRDRRPAADRGRDQRRPDPAQRETLTTNNIPPLRGEAPRVFNSSTAALLSLRARVTGGTIVAPTPHLRAPAPCTEEATTFVAVPNLQVFKREKTLRTRAATLVLPRRHTAQKPSSPGRTPSALRRTSMHDPSQPPPSRS